ncbi:hypothetical protein NKH77_00955 [Streptomyces sp. M19]
MGFTYLKIDFIGAGAVPGARSTDIGREAAYRLGLEIIREEAGPDAYLLGSGAPCCRPWGCSTGYAAARTSRRCGSTTPPRTPPTPWPATPSSTPCTGCGRRPWWRSTRTSSTSAAV